MSKVKTKKKHSPGQTQKSKSIQKNNTAKEKRKQWMVQRYKKKKPPPVEKSTRKPEKLVPPTDAQQFSANWKKLQEVNVKTGCSVLADSITWQASRAYYV